MNQFSYDVVIVGAGIVGLAHAWEAAKRGKRVLVCERTAQAQGATVRNFGMVWPVGQPSGEKFDLAQQSAACWQELADQNVLQVESCGSIHVAYRPDELAVLEEYAERFPQQVSMLTPDQVSERSEIVNPNGLLGGLWSDTEKRVNPRVAAAKIAAWLQTEKNIEFQFSTWITSVDDRLLTASDGRQFRAQQVLICCGSDIRNLYPAQAAELNLRLCKLQMFKCHQPRSVAVGATSAPHIASGLTLRHYTSFQLCPSLTALCDRIESETPELNRYGIHVMASHFPNGDVILGDSHEYDEAISPFDNPEIEHLMLRELRKIPSLTNWEVTERWSGVYAKHSSDPIVARQVDTQVYLITGTGGAGMTLSFGLANRFWNQNG